MARGIALLDVSPPLHPHTPQPPSTASSSLSSLTVLIIILSSALVLSVFFYLLLRYLSPSPSSSSSSSSSSTTVSAKSTLVAPSLPVFPFSSLTSKTNDETEAADCAICLANFEPTDQLRLLPLCCHAFHAHCIDMWLSCSHDTCPLCRSTVYPTETDVQKQTLPSLTRGNSYRIEIGSLSQRHVPETLVSQNSTRSDTVPEALVSQNSVRSNTVPDALVSQNSVRSNTDGLHRSYSVGPFDYVVQGAYEVSVVSGSDKDLVTEGCDIAGRGWLMDYVDRTFSRRSSGRFRNGSVRQNEGVGPMEDLETSRFGEEISEIFRWLSGV